MRNRLIVALALMALTSMAGEVSTIRIGVLAKRGTERCLEKWGPTADYLSETVPHYRFKIVPLNFDQIFIAAQNNEVEFLLGNPAIYIELSVRFNAARIATLDNVGPDELPHAVFGSVIFARKTDSSIRRLSNLKGKTVAAVDVTSFGGWLIARRELQTAGLIPDKDFEVFFLGTHDQVVYAVRDGRADAGTIRTDTLERMAMEGKSIWKTIPFCPARQQTRRTTKGSTFCTAPAFIQNGPWRRQQKPQTIWQKKPQWH